jgi:hypothetical protein
VLGGVGAGEALHATAGLIEEDLGILHRHEVRER